MDYRLNDMPTIIDGPGEYVTRGGTRVTIHTVTPSDRDTTAFSAKGQMWRRFRGREVPRGHDIWHVSGRHMPLKTTAKDIVSRLAGTVS